MAFLTGQSWHVPKSWYANGGQEQKFRCGFTNCLNQAPVVQKLDSAIHRINHYSVDKYRENNYAIHWIEIYMVGSAIHLLNNWRQKFSSVCGRGY